MARTGVDRTRRRRLTGPVGVVVAVAALAAGLAGGAASAATVASSGPVPTALAVDGEEVCAGRALVASDSLHLLATATGSAGSPAVLQFQVRSASGEVVTSPEVDAVVGSRTGWTTPVLPDGPSSFRVRETTRDASGTLAAWGAWAGSGRFSVDTTPPADPTGASSLDVPLGDFGPYGAPAATSWDASQPVLGSPGSILVTAPRGVDLVQVAWESFVSSISGCGVDGPGVVPVVEGRVELPIPATLQAGPHWLSVRGVDQAGNVGATVSQRFFLAPYVAGYQPGSDRIEGDSLAVRAPASAPTAVQRDVRLSGGAQLEVATSRPGQQVRLTLPVAAEGDYGLQLGALAGDHRGRVQVLVDGALQIDGQGDPLAVDLYAATTQHVEEYASGGVLHLTAGRHTVTLLTLDPDPASRDRVTAGVHDHGDSVVVDYLRLVRFPS